MRPFWSLFLRHALVVGISLAVVGYILGKGFLISQRMYGGEAGNAENEQVLWKTPLVMAGIGIGITAVIDLLAAFLRRPLPVAATPVDSRP